LKKFPILVSLLLIFSIFLFPTSDGDVALVPGAEIRDNTIQINITLNGDEVFLNITNNFTLFSYLDDIFLSTISTEKGLIINSDIIEPLNASINDENNEFSIWYSTINDVESEIYFQYNYKIHYKNIDGVDIIRKIESSSFYQLWTEYFAYIHDFKVIINSNKQVFANSFSEFKNGTEIELSYIDNYFNQSLGYSLGWWVPYLFQIKINWSNGSRIDEISELINCDITENHLYFIPNLIIQEEVDVFITKLSNINEYQLKAKFILSREIVSYINPVYLWFPENGTEIYANLSYLYKEHEELNCSKCINCKVKNGIRFGQNGFYIHIPELEEEWKPILNNPVLNVTINGTLNYNYFDFHIVTIPRENSTISINLPSIFEISQVTSPFELYDYNNDSTVQNYITFYGKCQELDKIHIEWQTLPDSDGDLVPDKKDDFPKNPKEWIDFDNDGIGDNSDLDIDNDGYNNSIDNFPYNPLEWNDTDYDDIGDNSDIDIDGDGFENNNDKFPYIPTEWDDTDNDGLGDNFADIYPNDYDNDGHSDSKDEFPNDPTKWKKESSKDEEDNDYYWISIIIVIIIIIILVTIYFIKKKE